MAIWPCVNADDTVAERETGVDSVVDELGGTATGAGLGSTAFFADPRCFTEDVGSTADVFLGAAVRLDFVDSSPAAATAGTGVDLGSSAALRVRFVLLSEDCMTIFYRLDRHFSNEMFYGLP